MTKIVFFDYDNTLFSHATHSVPESVYTALDALKQKGIKTCLCTGRCKYEIENYFDLPRLKFDYYIYFNGQQVIDSNDNNIYSVTLNGIDKESVKIIFDEKKIPIVLGTKDDYYINFVNDQVYYTCVTCSSSPTPKIHEYVEDELYMCSIFPGEMDNFDEFIKTNFPNCHTTRWTKGSYDVLLNGCSKADGIEHLLQYLNIAIEDTMSFGDGDNDIEMMKRTGISIAMGNGDENVKKYATYITTDIDDDGIYNGLKHFNLI